MKKYLDTLFLFVFFVLSNVTGLLGAGSLSYGDSPITGTLTLSKTAECKVLLMMQIRRVLILPLNREMIFMVAVTVS